ncbi:hypothetical protein E4U43_003494 [Claviceps pusilla]|uniref:Uncharacterized protein n=1 Tax=Claviceps pusilla TaxID=123648 RepID=A0A9P7SUI5_9HYPO|nr:hypothetical protein E4U43_003494 [Claviceps pusilla]
MPSPKRSLAILTLTLLSTASSAIIPPETRTETRTETASLPRPTTPAAPAQPRPCSAGTPGCRAACDYAFCDENGTSWCFYWYGVTGWDVSGGVHPAETRVPLGECHGV